MSHIVDSYSEINYSNDYPLYGSVESGYITMAQSFTGDGSKTPSCKFYLKKVGSPTGNAWVRIYTHAGVYGTSSYPTGLNLAVSSFLDVSTLTTDYQLITFNFSGINQITLEDGTYYVISIEYIGGDVDNRVVVGTDNTSPSHSGNASFVIDGWWNYSDTIDTCFYVYGEANWYNNNWKYRVKATVLATKVDADLTDYPVYVDLSGLPAGFHTNVNQTDGRDIRVTKANGTTEVPREVVFYDADTDTGELHFKGDVDSDVNTDFWIYYGNASATEPAVDSTYGAENVWTNGYEAVWHLNEASGSVIDSTSNSYDSTSLTATGRASAGQVGKSIDLSADADDVGFGDVLDLGTNDLTISAWIKTTQDTTGKWGFFATKAKAAAQNYRYGVGVYGNKVACFFQGDGGADVTFGDTQGTTDIHTGSWFYLNYVFDRSASVSLYVNDGAAENSAAISQWDTKDFQFDNPFRLGHYSAANNIDGILPYNGYLDEVRISFVTRTTTWISTEYNNQSSPSTFYSVGNEETSPSRIPKHGAINFQNPAIV